MSDILNLLCEATQPQTTSPAYRKARQAALPYWDKVQDALSYEFVDEMYTAVNAVWSIECDEHFARGFRLGAQLMLEIIPRPVSRLP